MGTDIRLEGVTCHYGAHKVLDGISWRIEAGSKIGLVGANGAGKSTLLRAIAGEVVPTSGSIIVAAKRRLGLLSQEPVLCPERSVWQEALRGDLAALELQSRLRELEKQMAQPEIYGDSRLFDRIMGQYARTQQAFEDIDGYRHENRARGVLARLGVESEQFDQLVGTLSGGEKKLVGLTQLLVGRCGVLLLDEPGNHLDLARKAHLEGLITAFPGTVVLVSHDRYLLDNTVDIIAELEGGKLELYDGNYTCYAVEKDLRRLQAERRFHSQQRQIAHLEASIARFEQWARQQDSAHAARQARSRRKMLDRMDKLAKPKGEQNRMGLNLKGWRGSERALRVRDLRIAFPAISGEVTVLDGIDLELRHGERVGLLGPNGAGKSVLLRSILGLLDPASGEIVVGPSVRLGYYAQQHETLDLTKTLIEEIRHVKPMREGEAVAFLGKFLFDYDAAQRTVGELSGGERSRLQLAKLMLASPNLLLLDEPTNNLDPESCEVLERNLAEFEGAVLAASHDRYFLDRVIDRIVELDYGALTEYPGDYTYYSEKKQENARTGQAH